MTGASLQSYLRASLLLKDAIAINRSDTAFVERGGEICYLFDTNVVEAYLRADNGLLGGAFGSGDLFTPEAATISTGLTLKYLFSGSLPGQQKQPVYVSQDHWNEVLGRANTIAAESVVVPAGQGADDQNLGEALRQLEAHRDSPKALLEVARTLDLGATFIMIAKAASANARLKTIFSSGGPDGQPALRDISHSQYWTAAMDTVRADDVRFWRQELNARRLRADARREARGQRRRGEAPQTWNVEHDAMTLAIIQALYRENPEAGGDRPNLRFVLVTADSAIENAVRDNGTRLENEGIAPFLRHPRVYMPLLNFSNMHRALLERTPEQDEVRGVFNEVEEAVKALFPFEEARSTTSKYTQHWRVRDYVDKWSAAAERLVVVNGQYLTMDATENARVLRDITDILQAPDVLAATAKLLSGTLSNIRGKHAQDLAVLALSRLTRARERARTTDGRKYIPRAPLKLVGVDYLAPIRRSAGRIPGNPRHLEQVLAGILDEPPEGGLLDAIVAELGEAWENPRHRAAARLLAASIYFGVGAWASARLCAELCFDTLRRQERFGPWAREATYCRALAIRMSLATREEFDKANLMLSENISTFDVSLATARDRVERAALILTASVAQTIENAHPATPGQLSSVIDFIDPHEIPNRFDGAIREMRRALEEVENFERDDAYTAGRVRVHAVTNILAAAIFAYFMEEMSEEGRTSLAAVSTARQSLHDALQEFGLGEGSMAAQLYARTADYILRPSPEAAASHIAFFEGLQDAHGELSWTDRIERAYILRQLRAGLLVSKSFTAVADADIAPAAL